MNIDLTKLITNIETYININEEIEIEEELLKNSTIKKLSLIKVDGRIKKILDEYEFSGTITGTMTLPDDLTLEEVELPINIQFEEYFTENDYDNENNLTIIQNRLDIIPFLWQNIVLEVPLKVTNGNNKNIKLEGDGWRLITEEDLEKEKSSPFKNLQDMIDKRKE